MASYRNVTVEDLLEHVEWVRALARSLVRGRDDADDVEQETWLSALERPPAHRMNLRAWLARILRRRRLDALRAARRRVWREQNASPHEAQPAAEDVLTRAELRARIAQEVLRLQEPYRSTVLLRFFEGLPEAEVARLQGVPAATVRTHVHRAVADLRRRLAGAGGDVHRLLAPLVGAWPDLASRVGTEVLVATTKIKVATGVAAAVTLIATTAWLVSTSSGSGTGPATHGPSVDGSGAQDVSRAQPTLAAAPNAQPAVAGSIGSREEGLQWSVREGADVGSGVVAGIVKDELGRPRTGISAILLENGDPAKQRLTMTDAEGRFRFQNLADGTHTLWLRWDRAELSRRVRSGARAVEVMLLLDPPLPEGVRRVRSAPQDVLGGVVQDPTGVPLPGCEVRLFDETGRGLLRTGSTGVTGEFRFENLEAGVLGLSFDAPGASHVFTYARVGSWLAVTLRTPTRIAGTVVEAGTEQPLGDIPVSSFRLDMPTAPNPSATTDATGAFSLQVGEGVWRITVGTPVVGRPGDAFVVQVLGPFSDGATGLRIDLERGGVIAGEVRGPGGGPWSAGASVFAYPITAEGKTDHARTRGGIVKPDGTFRITGLSQAPHEVSVTTMESPGLPAVFGRAHGVAAGTVGLVIDLQPGLSLVISLADEAGSRLSLTGGWTQVRPWGSEPGGPGSVSAVLRPDGYFESPPLDPSQSYVVVAGGFTGYTLAESSRVNPGDRDVVVRFDGVPFAGRVVDKAGTPVPKAVVYASTIGRTPPLAASAETTSDGSFRIPGAPRGYVRVYVSVAGQKPVDLGEYTTPAENASLTLP